MQYDWNNSTKVLTDASKPHNKSCEVVFPLLIVAVLVERFKRAPLHVTHVSIVCFTTVPIFFFHRRLITLYCKNNVWYIENENMSLKITELLSIIKLGPFIIMLPNRNAIWSYMVNECFQLFLPMITLLFLIQCYRINGSSQRDLMKRCHKITVPLCLHTEWRLLLVFTDRQFRSINVNNKEKKFK